MIFSSSTFVEIHQWMLALVDRRVDTFPVAILYSPSQRQRVAFLCRSISEMDFGNFRSRQRRGSCPRSRALAQNVGGVVVVVTMKQLRSMVGAYFGYIALFLSTLPTSSAIVGDPNSAVLNFPWWEKIHEESGQHVSTLSQQVDVHHRLSFIHMNIALLLMNGGRYC
jgi:hypothetical protein